ncbi:MAG: MAPEG family protein [Myxococcota bacterium]
MTTPFWCLLVTILLPYVWSGLAGYFRVQQLGSLDNKYPRIQSAQLTGVGARAYAAQGNAWEALPVFATSVFVAHFAGADPGTSATLSEVFVVARVVHGILYLANLDVLRTLTFFVGFGCCIGLFWISA